MLPFFFLESDFIIVLFCYRLPVYCLHMYTHTHAHAHSRTHTRNCHGNMQLVFESILFLCVLFNCLFLCWLFFPNKCMQFCGFNVMAGSLKVSYNIFSKVLLTCCWDACRIANATHVFLRASIILWIFFFMSSAFSEIAHFVKTFPDVRKPEYNNIFWYNY